MLERNAGQLAGEVVGPAVVDAGEFADIAAALDAQQIAAVGATIDERVDGTGRVAHDDHRGLADRGCDVIAWLGQFYRQAQVIPGRSLEQALLLALVLRRIRIEPEWHLAYAVGRPSHAGFRGQSGLGHGRLLLAGGALAGEFTRGELRCEGGGRRRWSPYCNGAREVSHPTEAIFERYVSICSLRKSFGTGGRLSTWRTSPERPAEIRAARSNAHHCCAGAHIASTIPVTHPCEQGTSHKLVHKKVG